MIFPEDVADKRQINLADDKLASGALQGEGAKGGEMSNIGPPAHKAGYSTPGDDFYRL